MSSYIILKNSSSSILSKYEVEEQHWSEEEFEDTKGVIRIRKLKKDRQHNDQKKRDKRTNNDLQNTHIATVPKQTNV
jgi:hypothetical protein